jgi:uncharacterized membrane protein
MELSPEERKRIYEEEKARLEAEERARRDSRQSNGSGLGLEPNVASLLCYLAMWVSGIIFLVLEQKNRQVRFHAAQSVVTFGSLTILSAILRWVPFAGPFFSASIGLLIFILWLVLMVKAYRGENYRLPLAAELADKLLAAIGQYGTSSVSKTNGVEQVVIHHESRPVARSRTGEVVGSAFAIAFGLAMIIFFNFYSQYFAYYYQSGGEWIRQPLLNSNFNEWLPVVTVALVFYIIGHMVLILIDRPMVREVVLIILDLFAIITIGSLLSIFPFNFEPLPVSASLVAWSLRTGLLMVMVVIGVIAVVRLVRLVLKIVRG